MCFLNLPLKFKTLSFTLALQFSYSKILLTISVESLCRLFVSDFVCNGSCGQRCPFLDFKWALWCHVSLFKAVETDCRLGDGESRHVELWRCCPGAGKIPCLREMLSASFSIVDTKKTIPDEPPLSYGFLSDFSFLFLMAPDYASRNLVASSGPSTRLSPTCPQFASACSSRLTFLL